MFFVSFKEKKIIGEPALILIPFLTPLLCDSKVKLIIRDV